VEQQENIKKATKETQLKRYKGFLAVRVLKHGSRGRER
jgi:hypothetical protein